MKVSFQFYIILVTALLVLLGCCNNKQHSIESGIEIELVQLDFINRHELLERKDIEQQNYKFDSVWFKWNNDTLLLNIISSAEGICGEFQFNWKLRNDTIQLEFNDTSNCELATIIELKTKVRINNHRNYTVFLKELNGKANLRKYHLNKVIK